MPNAYALSPHPCTAMAALCTGTAGPDKHHCRVKPGGGQCLCQGNYPQATIDAPPAGVTIKTLAECRVIAEGWDS